MRNIKNLLERKLTKESAKYYAAIVVLAVAAVFIDALVPFYLVLLPSLLIFKLIKSNLLVTLPIAIGLGLIITTCNAVLLDTFGIRLVGETLVVVSLVESLLLLAFGRKQLIALPSLDYKYVGGIYLLFLIVVWSRVGSVWQSLVPILHDPMSHAFWAKRIAEEHAIDYFYSPGLHVWTYLFSDGLGLTFAKSVNVLTNLFSAFSVLLWGISFGVIAKKAKLGFWVAVAFAISPMPAVLYYSAGKNSLIAALALMPLVFILCEPFLRKPSKYLGALLTLVLIGVGLFHYPVFLYSSVSYVLYVVLRSIPSYEGFWKFIRRVALLIVPVLIGAIVVGANMVITKGEEVSMPGISRPEAAAIQDEAKKDASYVPEVTKQPGPKTQAIDVRNPVRESKNTAKEFLNLITITSGPYSLLLVGMGIAFFILVLLGIRQEPQAAGALASLTVAVGVTTYIFSVVVISGLSTVADTGLFIFLPILLAGLCMVFSKISGKVLAISAVIGLVVVAVFAYDTRQTFITKTAHTQNVTSADIAAFDWIDKNIPPEEGFIGLAQRDPNRASVIFPIDSSTWIPVFTDADIANPFQEVRFNTKETNINYIYYQKLISKNDVSIQQALDYFTKNGFRYLYVDGDAGKSAFGLDNFVSNGFGEVVYSESGITLVMLQPRQ